MKEFIAKAELWIIASPRLAYFTIGAATGAILAALFWIAVLT